MLKTYSLDTDGKVVTREFIDLEDEMYAISVHGGRVVLGGDGNQAVETPAGQFKEFVPFADYKGAIREIQLDQSGKRVCILGDDKDIIVYDFLLKKKLRFENTEISGMVSCSWSPNGHLLATVSKKGTLSLFQVPDNFEKLELVKNWRISDKELKDEELHSINPVFLNDTQLMVGGKDIIQKIQQTGSDWEYSVESRLKHEGVIYSLSVLPNNLLASIAHDKTLKIWNPITEVELASYRLDDRIQRFLFVAEKDVLLAFAVTGNLFSLPHISKLTSKPVAAPKPEPIKEEIKNPYLPAPKPEPVKEEIKNPYLLAPEPTVKQVKPRNKLFEDEEEILAQPAIQLEDSMKSAFDKLDKLVADEDSSNFNPAPQAKLQIKIQDEPIKKNVQANSSVPKSAFSAMEAELPHHHNENGQFDSNQLPDEDETKSVSVAPEPSYHQLKQELNKEEAQHMQRMVGLRGEGFDEHFQLDKKRLNKVNKIVEEYFQTAPQKPSRLQGTTEQGKRNFLCYNNYGKVVSSIQGNVALLDINYSVQDISKRLETNKLGFNMASITYRGVLLGSTGFDESADEYLNEEDDPDSRFAHVRFIPSAGGSGWTVKLEDKENITAVALGQNWAAVTTSRNFIRFFYLDSGKNYKTIGSPASVVGLAAYEQYLAVLYNTTMPFSGAHCQSVRVINVSCDRVVYESAVVLSPKSKTKWFGFSEEGSLCIQDTGKVLWSLVNEHLWVPIYDGASLKGDYFVITITGQKIMLIRLPEGHTEPSPMVNFQPVLRS